MLANSLQKNSSTILALFVALGFAFILVELLTLGHTRGPQMISIIACALGIVLALGSIVANNMRKLIAILFVVLALTGLFGFMVHGGTRGFRKNMAASVTSEDRTVQRALASFTNLPPTLAPLILTGLSLFGAAVTLMATANPRLETART